MPCAEGLALGTSGQQAVDIPAGQEPGHEGGRVAVDEKGSHLATDGSQPGSPSPDHETADGVDHRHRRSNPGRQGDPEVPIDGAIGGAHASVEAAAFTPMRRPDRCFEEDLPFSSRNPHGHDPQVPPGATLTTSPTTPSDDGEGIGQEGQGQGQESSSSVMLGSNRPAYLAKIMQLPLLNPSNICYANATVQAWLWATICCICPLEYLWGDKKDSILQWVTDLDCSIP